MSLSSAGLKEWKYGAFRAKLHKTEARKKKIKAQKSLLVKYRRIEIY